MRDSSSSKGVIPARTVRRVDQAVLVDAGSTHDESGHRSLTIVPLVEGDRIAALEIRCACGTSAVVECVYEAE